MYLQRNIKQRTQTYTLIYIYSLHVILYQNIIVTHIYILLSFVSLIHTQLCIYVYVYLYVCVY